MAELKKCFESLGFTEAPETEQEVEERFSAKLEQFKDSTESHRLARQILRESRELCLEELRKA